MWTIICEWFAWHFGFRDVHVKYGKIVDLHSFPFRRFRRVAVDEGGVLISSGSHVCTIHALNVSGEVRFSGEDITRT